jgi:hypothetical protein
VAVTRGDGRQPVGARFLAAHDTTVNRSTVADLDDLLGIELTDTAGTVLASVPLP